MQKASTTYWRPLALTLLMAVLGLAYSACAGNEKASEETAAAPAAPAAPAASTAAPTPTGPVTIQGIVKNEKGNQLLRNAIVMIDRGVTIEADSLGVFSYQVPAGGEKATYELIVSREGYKASTVTYHVGSGRMDIRLANSYIQDQDVEINFSPKKVQ